MIITRIKKTRKGKDVNLELEDYTFIVQDESYAVHS